MIKNEKFYFNIYVQIVSLKGVMLLEWTTFSGLFLFAFILTNIDITKYIV